MLKPASIRALLTSYLPALARDPERLRMWIDKGNVRTRQTESFSFELVYRLNIVVIDWTDEPIIIMALLNEWLRRYQPDAVASQAAPGYSFEADIVTNTAMDLSIELDLSEAVRRVPKEDGDGYDLQVVEEPESFPDESAPEPPVLLKEIFWKGERLVPLDPP